MCLHPRVTFFKQITVLIEGCDIKIMNYRTRFSGSTLATGCEFNSREFANEWVMTQPFSLAGGRDRYTVSKHKVLDK